jgi:hypothetical protein
LNCLSNKTLITQLLRLLLSQLFAEDAEDANDTEDTEDTEDAEDEEDVEDADDAEDAEDAEQLLGRKVTCILRGSNPRGLCPLGLKSSALTTRPRMLDNPVKHSM